MAEVDGSILDVSSQQLAGFEADVLLGGISPMTVRGVADSALADSLRHPDSLVTEARVSVALGKLVRRGTLELTERVNIANDLVPGFGIVSQQAA